MNRIFENANSQHVAATIVYANADKALFYDKAFQKPVGGLEAADLFAQGVVCFYNGAYYKPTACTKDGVMTFGTFNEGLYVFAEATVDDTVDLFGKVVSDLQEGVYVDGLKVKGAIKYVADYSSAYGPGMDKGYYVVLHFDATPGATITCTGDGDPVVLDADGILIRYIDPAGNLKITVEVSKSTFDSVTKVYDLSELVFLPK